MRLRASATALLVLLATAPAASALTVSGSSSANDPPVALVDIVDRVGEANELEVAVEGSVMTVVDRRATVEAQGSCTQVDPHTAVCPNGYPSVSLAEGADIAAVELETADSAGEVRGGPGPDRLSGSGARLLGDAGDDELRGGRFGVYMLGGPGDDLLVGGTGDDHLEGGSSESSPDFPLQGEGADELRGGEGSDRVTYAGSAPVRVALDAVADDGRAGEGDLVAPDVEAVFAGDGNDSLIGDADAEQLSGGAGDDELVGGGGADGLRGDAGADRLAGGGGDDALYGDGGADTILGGDGADSIQAAEGDGLAAPAPDRVSCGAARDYVGSYEEDDAIDDTCEETFGRPWSQRFTQPGDGPRRPPASPTPTPTPTAAPTPAPTPVPARPSVTGPASVALRSRRAILPLTCASSEGCAGSLVLSARRARRTVRLARADYALAQGRSRLRVRLSRRGARALRGRRTVRARLALTDGSGAVTRRSITLRLR